MFALMRKRAYTWYTWEARSGADTPASLIGFVYAPDQAKAKERAIEQFDIPPEDRDQLLVRRYQ